MSIATNEAGERYPVTYEDELTANFTHEREQQAYVAGRIAEPTEAEIEAAAFAHYKTVTTSAYQTTDEEYWDMWRSLPPMVRDEFIRNAQIDLTVARKAVTE